MDGLIQIQVVVQGNAGAVGLMGLDTQGRVWYGELSGAPSPARYSVKWTKVEERQQPDSEKAFALRSEIRRAGWFNQAVTKPRSCGAVLVRVLAFGQTWRKLLNKASQQTSPTPQTHQTATGIGMVWSQHSTLREARAQYFRENGVKRTRYPAMIAMASLQVARIPRKIKALPLLLAERATDRATERERKAQRYGRATERAQRSPPDKMVMGWQPTLHDENSAIIPARRALGHVEVVWYRESAPKLTWELPGPRIVALEHAEQSRDQDAPAGAGVPIAAEVTPWSG